MKWRPIADAPKDNRRPLYIAQFREDGVLEELDWDAIWETESESWEIPQVYYVWKSANGRVEEPTHFAFMDETDESCPCALPDPMCMDCGGTGRTS